MFTCSSGVSFLRNFPKYRVHFAAALSLTLFCYYISDVLLVSLFTYVGEYFQFRFLHCSLLRGDGGVVGFVFVPALCIGVIPGGCFAWSPKEFN